MKYIATCYPKLENIAIQEIKELINTKSKIINQGRLELDTTEEKIALLINHTQSINKIYKLLIKTTEKEIINNPDKLKINQNEIKEPYKIIPLKQNTEISSLKIIEILTKIINKKVNLKIPTTYLILDIIENNIILGIDYTGEKLAKRDYRIKPNSGAINPIIAYNLLRIADIKDNENILDPFCKSGEIPIESAIYLTKKSLQIFREDKLLYKNYTKSKYLKEQTTKSKIYCTDSLLSNIKSAQINAKIIEIHKTIDFSKQDLKYIDQKFEENKIDKIITFPPFPSKHITEEKMNKLYKELFHQAKYILKPKGTITLFTPTPKLLLIHSDNFKKLEEIKINYINRDFYIIKLQNTS